MIVSKQLVSEEELHAYIDGRLDAQQCKAVEHFLAEHPEEAERVRTYQRLNQSLQQAYATQLRDPVPKRLQVKAVHTRWAFLQRW